MRARLLNRTVTIKRKDVTESGLTDTGDILTNQETLIATGVKIRITTNKVVEPTEINFSGGWMSSTFLGFTFVGNDIRINDILQDEASDDRYLVAWVDKNPGGTSDSHYEIYMNDARNE